MDTRRLSQQSGNSLGSRNSHSGHSGRTGISSPTAPASAARPFSAFQHASNAWPASQQSLMPPAQLPPRTAARPLRLFTQHMSTVLEQAAAAGDPPLQLLQTQLANTRPYDIVFLQNVFDIPPTLLSKPALVTATATSLGAPRHNAASAASAAESQLPSPSPSSALSPPRKARATHLWSKALTSLRGPNTQSHSAAGAAAGSTPRIVLEDADAKARAPTFAKVVSSAMQSSIPNGGRSKWYPVHGYYVCGTHTPILTSAKQVVTRDAGLLVYSRYPIRAETFVAFQDQPNESMCGMLLAEIEVDGMLDRLLVCNVHFASDATDAGAQSRTRQVHELISTLQIMYPHMLDRLLLSGSFNMNAKSVLDASQLLLLMWRLNLETAVDTHVHELAEQFGDAGLGSDVRDYIFVSRALGHVATLAVTDKPVDPESSGTRVHLPLVGMLHVAVDAGTPMSP
ncbi:hypothetical protein BC831DRAFT_225650 [Entophlyctis helioformis]|nr:hypothetical protein BC831DRAFT_225650 [Entophlyctis helioformis]